jgi:hypothetical protein
MILKYKYLIFTAVITLFITTSCFNDLNVVPLDDDVETSALIYQNPESYKQVLAKIYAGLAVSGQEGPAGQPDISGIDEGFSTYLRQYWKAQELTTDEAVIAWNDGNIHDYEEMDWDANNEFVTAMYNRIFFQITLINEFLRESTPEKLESRGADAALQAEVATYQLEARFMRALSYWHALDMFRNPPFVTEEDGIGSFFPEQVAPTELFNYIESELLDIEDKMVAPQQNEYGRADQGAAWMLLAKLYLNAEVYTGIERNTDAITFAKKVIDAGYNLEPNYAHLFMADNHNSNEIIFSVNFDGLATRTWGGMTFLIHAAVGGSMNAGNFGIDNGWGGYRTTPEFAMKFDTSSSNADSRSMFFTENQSFTIDPVTNFQQGWAYAKYSNKTTAGENGSNLTFPDTDFPMFRLADAYLIYAEAVLRGGTGGDIATAVSYINELRERAYGDASGNITQNDLTLPFILDERGRELYIECHRRTDLIRFGLFTSGYNWSLKGNNLTGQDVDEKYNIFPIPSSDLGANPNLIQNSGY